MTKPLVLHASAILFDMDGVLVDSRAVMERVWRDWAAEKGYDAASILPIAHGRRAGDTLRIVAPALDPIAEAARLDAAEANDFEGMVQIPGAAALVRSLPRHRWAIVTSAGTQLALGRLNASHVPAPDVIISADMITRGKPDPEGYLKGAATLGVAPDDCVVFEDAPPGIEAARRAGIRVIGVATTHPASELTSTERIVRDLTQVVVHATPDGLEIRVS